MYLCLLCVRFVFVLMVRTKTTLRRGRRKRGRTGSTMRVRARSLRRGTLRSRRQGGMFGSTSLQRRDVDTLKRGCRLVAEGTFHKTVQKLTTSKETLRAKRFFRLYINDDDECRILYFDVDKTTIKGTRILSQMMMEMPKDKQDEMPEDKQDEIHFSAKIRQSGSPSSPETDEPLNCKFLREDYIQTQEDNVYSTAAVNTFYKIVSDPHNALTLILTPTPPSPAASNSHRTPPSPPPSPPQSSALPPPLSRAPRTGSTRPSFRPRS